MKSIQYLTFDSIQEGVGSSQVFSYLKRLSSSWDIELVNFEKKIEESDMQKVQSSVSIGGLSNLVISDSLAGLSESLH